MYVKIDWQQWRLFIEFQKTDNIESNKLVAIHYLGYWEDADPVDIGIHPTYYILDVCFGCLFSEQLQ